MTGDEKAFFTVNEMLDELDETSRYVRLWYSMKRLPKNLARIPGKIKNAYQRARYGVGYQDAWSLDTHIARVIDRGARHLYEANNSYLGEHNGWTEEKWQVFLMELSTAAEAYANEQDNDKYLIDMFKQRMHEMVDNFEMMWD